MDGLIKAISIAGGNSALARLIGEPSAQTISNWKRRGVPQGKVLAIVRALGGQVTPYELRPDLYPDPDWLPKMEGAA